MAGARALFRHSPFDFERWVVTPINARPTEKQVGDKGVDGVARFYLGRKTRGRLLVSVKGNPGLPRARIALQSQRCQAKPAG